MISVIIPAWNEQETVGNVVRGVLGALSVVGGQSEVIVVDDGSTDTTVRQARLAGALVLERAHEGKGLAVRAGFDQARGDTIVLMDSDGQDVPAELPVLIRAFRSSGADFVNGSRFLGTFRHHGISPLDFLGNRLLTWTANLLFLSRLSDLNASFRVIRRSAIKGFAWRFTEFEVESEMLLKARRAGLEILEVPVTRERRLGGVRRFRRVRHGTRILLTILYVRFLWHPPKARTTGSDTR